MLRKFGRLRKFPHPAIFPPACPPAAHFAALLTKECAGGPSATLASHQVARLLALLRGVRLPVTPATQQPQQPATTADSATAAATAAPGAGVAATAGSQAAAAGAAEGADQRSAQGSLLHWQLLAKDVLLLQAFMAQVNR